MARGSYAEYAVVPAWQLVKIPASVDFETAAAAMLQGMTAHYLTHSTYPLKPGDSCLIHAAAGGTGRLIVQMAKMLGARVIGTVGTEEKAKQAKEAGADEVIIYTKEDFTAKAKGMHVVYDSVGQSTFMKSLDCLRPRGMMVSFGNASGPVAEFCSAHSEPEGFAVSDSSHAGELYSHRRRAGLARQRRVELDRTRQAEAAHPQGLSACRRPPRRIAIWKAARPPESCCCVSADRAAHSVRRAEDRRAAGLRAAQCSLPERLHRRQRPAAGHDARIANAVHRSALHHSGRGRMHL